MDKNRPGMACLFLTGGYFQKKGLVGKTARYGPCWQLYLEKNGCLLKRRNLLQVDLRESIRIYLWLGRELQDAIAMAKSGMPGRVWMGFGVRMVLFEIDCTRSRIIGKTCLFWWILIYILYIIYYMLYIYIILYIMSIIYILLDSETSFYI